MLGTSSQHATMLMKPFHHFNKVNVVYLPVTSSVSCCDIDHLVQFLKHLKAKRVLMTANIKAYVHDRLDDQAASLNGELEVGTCVEVVGKSGEGAETTAADGSCLIGRISRELAEDVKMEKIEAAAKTASDPDANQLKMIGKIGSVKIHWKDQLVQVERQPASNSKEQLYAIGDIDFFS